MRKRQVMLGKICLVPAVCFVLLSVSQLSAQPLIVCDFNGTEPALNTPWTQVSYIDPNLGYSGFQLGAGAHPAAGINDVFAFYVTAGATNSTLAESIADNEYLYFAIQPTAGTLDLNGKKVNFSIQRIDYHAPMQYAVFTSVGGFSEGGELFTTASTGKGDYTLHEHSFIMPATGYDGLTGPVEFRIYAYEAQYSGHKTTLTAFSIEQAAPTYTLTLNSSAGGTASSNPDGTTFEQGTVVRLIAAPDPGYHFTGFTGDVTGLGNPRAITMDSDKTVTANFAPNPEPNMTVGTNLGGVEDWSTDWVFVDAFKMARNWLTRSVGGYEWDSQKSGEIPLDANGWPSQLPFTASDGNDHYVHTLMPAFAAGDYNLILEGAGEIEFSGAAAGHFYPAGGTGTYTLTVPPGGEGTLFIKILTSSPADHIRNIRVIMPGFSSTYQSQPFHPLFLERLEPFVNLRFMDWAKTNASPLATWSGRTTPDTYTQTLSSGVALEYMVRLANTLGKNPWLCIPHQADDNYITQTARLLRDSVGANLKIYVEYSNETWNTAGAFPQTTYVQDMGEALGLAPGDRWLAGQKYVALRSVQIWEIFLNEFVDDSRLVKVMATQSANVNVTNMRFGALNDPAINPNYTMPDVLAIAPYFGKNWKPADLPPNVPDYPTIDEILDTIAPAKIADVRDGVIAQKAVADTQGCKLVCYEAGQHFVGISGAENDDTLTNILTGANRDPRMYGRYLEYLCMLNNEGVDMCGNFSFCGRWSKWGSWAVLEYMDQPIAEAPKYHALVDWINFGLLGDLNNDCSINLLDADILADQWLTIPDPCEPNCADLDDTNNVDFKDFAVLGQNFGL